MPVWYASIVSTEIFYTKIQPARYHPPNKWNPSEVAPGGHFGSTTFTPQSFPPFSPWNLNPSENQPNKTRKWSIMVFGDSELGLKNIVISRSGRYQEKWGLPKCLCALNCSRRVSSMIRSLPFLIKNSRRFRVFRTLLHLDLDSCHTVITVLFCLPKPYSIIS